MPGALEGLRVVDLTTGLAGPIATMMLSDHGADVVKVEPPGGDPQRGYVGSVVTNRGKRSVVLDLDVAADRDRLLALVDTADVLVESFAPGHLAGTRARLRDRRRPERPALVYCSLTGYPRTTDAADRPAIDLLVQARSGMQYEQPGFRDGPIFLHAPLPSIAASYLTVEGDPRRAVRPRDHRPRAVGGDVAVPGCARVHHAAVAGRRAPSSSRGSRSGASPAAEHLRVRRRPVGPLDALGRRSGQGPQRRSGEILGIDPPDLDWSPIAVTGVRRSDRPRGDRAHEAPGPARPVLGQRDPDRAGAPRPRGARRRAGRQQRHVGRGRRPGARPVRQAGIAFRLHGAPTADGAGTPTRGRSAHRRGARVARRSEPARAREHAPGEAIADPRARGHQGPRPRQLPRRSVRPDAARRPGRDRLQARVAPGRPDAAGHPAVQRMPARASSTSSSTSRQPEGLRDRAPPHPRGRRRAPQHAPRRRRAARGRLRDRQAAQPDRDLLPHDDVGQRRPARHVARVRPARAVVVRARARARRRGQRTQLVPLRHVRPGVRGAVGARGADGACTGASAPARVSSSTRRS